MNEFIKENWFKILLLLVFMFGVFFVFSFFSFKNDSVENSVHEVKKLFSENDLSFATQITCTYPQILSVAYDSGEISHSLNKPETHPIIFTFSKLDDSKSGQLSYIDATQSITTVSIIKLHEDSEKVIYLDGNGENYLSIHTIYKKLGVSTYTKSVSLLGIPLGSLAMGNCVGY